MFLGSIDRNFDVEGVEQEMVTIRREMRVNENGESEVWTNLDDILKWLDELPELSNSRIADDVTAQIGTMLYDSVADAPLRRANTS